jgi:beta-ribofuranosylaminobenzene 5'-phosphate synthase
MGANLKVTVPSRIAISLYDMNGSLGRNDGGMGFSLKWPRLCFFAKKNNKKRIEVYCPSVSNEMKESIVSCLELIQKLYDLDGIFIKITETIPEHSGFGSKTATLLSISYIYLKLYCFDIDFRDLAIIIKRGGTSGIGINIIDKGGFLLEGGHSTSDKKEFLPSSSVKKINPAPVLARYDMPEWTVLICIPNLHRVYGINEKKFFANKCPIKEEDVSRLARITLSQALPSILEKDMETFCQAINQIQKFGWKKSEIEIYGAKLRFLMDKIIDLGALSVGMSSIGPGLYVFGRDLHQLRDLMLSNYNEIWENVQLTNPSNTGIIIEEAL